MSMNLEVYIKGEKLDIPQTTTDETFAIINSDNPKEALLEYLSSFNELPFEWEIDPATFEQLSDDDISYVYKLGIQGMEPEEINKKMGRNIYKKERAFNRLIKRIEDANDDEIEFRVV